MTREIVEEQIQHFTKRQTEVQAAYLDHQKVLFQLEGAIWALQQLLLAPEEIAAPPSLTQAEAMAEIAQKVEGR